MAKLKTMTEQECEKRWVWRFPLTSRMICADDNNKQKQVWRGDSGGSLTVVEKGKHFLVGVPSFAKCNPSIPQGFGRVTSVEGWIKERMRGITCEI